MLLLKIFKRKITIAEPMTAIMSWTWLIISVSVWILWAMFDKLKFLDNNFWIIFLWGIFAPSIDDLAGSKFPKENLSKND